MGNVISNPDVSDEDRLNQETGLIKAELTENEINEIIEILNYFKNRSKEITQSLRDEMYLDNPIHDLILAIGEEIQKCDEAFFDESPEQDALMQKHLHNLDIKFFESIAPNLDNIIETKRQLVQRMQNRVNDLRKTNTELKQQLAELESQVCDF